MKTAILFATHTSSNHSISLLNKLCDDLKDCDNVDIYILFDGTKNNKWNSSIPENCKGVYYFSPQIVQDHGFTMRYFHPYNKVKPFYGNNYEYSFMSFYKDHLEYDYIYLIEHDVYFNGNWKVLIDNHINDNTDFIASDLILYDKIWDQWIKLLWIINIPDNCINIKDEKRYKSFNPICRFSKRSLLYLVKLADMGCYGFYECYIPTVLNNNGFTIKQWEETIGSDQNDVASSMKYTANWYECYTNATMDKLNILYHPVKY